jgi:hypothetical protein
MLPFVLCKIVIKLKSVLKFYFHLDFNFECRTKLLGDIFKAMRNVVWPDDADLIGTIHGLLRAQHTYMLPATEVVKGKLRNRQTLAQISVEDSMLIAQSRLSGESPLRNDLHIEYALAIEWAEAALM